MSEDIVAIRPICTCWRPPAPRRDEPVDDAVPSRRTGTNLYAREVAAQRRRASVSCSLSGEGARADPSKASQIREAGGSVGARPQETGYDSGRNPQAGLRHQGNGFLDYPD